MLMPMLWKSNKDDEMNLMNPFAEMDKMFDDFWGNDLGSAGSMRTDVIDDGKNYKLEADLPGFNREDIHVDLKNDMLTISAAHDENKDEKDKNGKYIRRERRSASYQRSFRVENLNTEDINAQYRNGVLTVTFPKKEAIPEKEDARRIEVKD